MNAKETLKLVKKHDFKWPLGWDDQFVMCEVDYLEHTERGDVFSMYKKGFVDFDYSLVCDKESFDAVGLQYLIMKDILGDTMPAMMEKGK